MKKVVLVALALCSFTISANACIGGGTNVTAAQIEAVVEAVRSDYSVDFASIVSIQISGNEASVTLKHAADGISTQVYTTSPAEDSGSGDKCDKKVATLKQK